MHRIIEKQVLAPAVVLFKAQAPLIAAERKAGQFVMLHMGGEYDERIPLTIVDSDAQAGTITLIVKAVGRTTHELAELAVGDSIANIAGPLGTPTHIERFGTAVCVGGGIGTAPLYPIVKALRESGNRIISIIGAKSRDAVVFESEIRALSDEIILCTDDGSYGRKDLVTAPLKEICERPQKPDFVIAIGPAQMMRFCAETTRPYGIRTMASLNTIMIDGTGMCGGCRVTVGDTTKFVCVDGPEFDAHKVDFKNMVDRLAAYKDQEDDAHHKCHAELAAQGKRKA